MLTNYQSDVVIFFEFVVSFYPRDVMLALRVLAMAVCLCLSACLSQVGSSIETVEQIELGVGMGASFHLHLHCVREIRVSPK